MPRRRFKVILLGNEDAGKTSVYSVLKGMSSRPPTPSQDMRSPVAKAVELPSGELVELDVWDTAGMERYRSIGTNYYHGTHAAILLYDTTNLKSFQDLGLWEEELATYAPDAIRFVFGTKIDIELEDEVVSEVSLQAFAGRYEVKECFKVTIVGSDGKRGVHEAFEIIAHYLCGKVAEVVENEKSVSLHESETQNRWGNCALGNCFS